MSGPSAHLGKDTENGALLAVEDLNARGVTIDGKTVKWVLLTEDDGGDPKQVTAVAQKPGALATKAGSFSARVRSGTQSRRG